MSTDSSYQENLVGFVEGVKESEAQWYSIKPLQNDIPFLPDLLKVSAENLQSLLVKFGFGKSGPNNKLFSFQASKFECFGSTFMIQDACETTQRKVKGMKTKQWFVRLGTHFMGDLSNPGTIGCAPRVKNIRAVRRDFQDAIAKMQQPTRAQENDEESREDDTEDEEGTHDPHKNNLVLLRVQQMLLPLLMKEELLNQDLWAPDIDSVAVVAALNLIVGEL
jgi:hypothetical protein